jgi:addiction module HigA family antidote
MKSKRCPTHPGEILLEEFLRPLGMTQAAFARHIGVPAQRVSAITRGERGVTADTAWLLAQALNSSPEFWLNLQSAHDLARTRPKRRIPRISGIR